LYSLQDKKIPDPATSGGLGTVFRKFYAEEKKFTTQGRKEGSTDQLTERPTYIIINFKFYCICTLFKTNSDVIILSRVFQRVLGQCQEGWLFWIAETTSKDGQEGWLNINIVNKEFPETLLTVSQIVFV